MATMPIGRDVAKWLSAQHVYRLLSDIQVEIDSRAGVGPYAIPEPLPDKRRPKKAQQDVQAKLRATAIAKAPRLRFPIRLESAQSTGESRLWALIIRTALSDFTKGLYSASSMDQRNALDAYWWIMGFGAEVQKTDDAIAEAKALRVRATMWQDPYFVLGVTRHDVTRTYSIDEPRSVPKLSDCVRIRADYASDFRYACDCLGICPASVQRSLSTINPLAKAEQSRQAGSASRDDGLDDVDEDLDD